MANGLKLKAQDKDDLTIISAYLQDAVTIVADFNFDASSRIFAVMLNRYLWEEHKIITGKDGKRNCHRIRTGCHFENVIRVSSQNFNHKDKQRPLELLAIESEALDNDNIAIDFIFAGDEVIRLEAELIEASMRDIGDPYPAACHPKHEVLDGLKD
tara:strand:- start:26348 stop:26815 length:468 start_codon:yes stop_codon:yes gene_type:complete